MGQEIVMEPFIVSIAQACELLGGTSRSSIHRLMNKGELEPVKLGRRTFITLESVKTLIAPAK